MRLKFQERSELKLVSRIIPKFALGFIPLILKNLTF